MSNWGSLPNGISEVSSCKNCGKGTMPANFDVLIAANNAVSGVDFGVDSASAHATTSSGRGRSV